MAADVVFLSPTREPRLLCRENMVASALFSLGEIGLYSSHSSK